LPKAQIAAASPASSMNSRTISALLNDPGLWMKTSPEDSTWTLTSGIEISTDPFSRLRLVLNFAISSMRARSGFPSASSLSASP
jgi:hypothetical protein